VRQTEAGVEYHFGAARNPSFATRLTAFLLIWTGALWLQIALGAPLIFPLVTGLFELLLLVIVTELWLGTTTMTINPRTIRCRHTIAGIGATRVMTPSEIAKIDLHISVQTTGRSGPPFYGSESRSGMVAGARSAAASGTKRTPSGSPVRCARRWAFRVDLGRESEPARPFSGPGIAAGVRRRSCL